MLNFKRFRKNRSLGVVMGIALLLTLFLLPAINPDSADAADITVSSLSDIGAGSLRQAVSDATVGQEINFSVTGTITLTSGEIAIGKNLTITGPELDYLTIDGVDTYRIFNISSGTVNISGVTLTNGKITGGALDTNNGGAILNQGTLNISNSTVSSSYAYDYGGAICNDGGTATVTECTISGNAAFCGAGLSTRSSGTLNVTRSTIYNNVNDEVPQAVGGGIHCSGGNLTVTNSTISGNTGDSAGGGIADDGATTTTINIVQCTIVNNTTAVSGGGGIDLAKSTANIKNTILANNTHTGDGGDNFYTGDLNSQGYNLANDDLSAYFDQGTDLNSTDPKLGSLADNNGPTQTHALQSGSDAIDEIPSGAPSTDQRGYDRSGNADIGAYEYNGTQPTLTVTEANDYGGGSTTPGTSNVRFLRLGVSTDSGRNGNHHRSEGDVHRFLNNGEWRY